MKLQEKIEEIQQDIKNVKIKLENCYSLLEEVNTESERIEFKISIAKEQCIDCSGEEKRQEELNALENFLEGKKNRVN